jgi:methyl-accepting chemotaxis protein WspA
VEEGEALASEAAASGRSTVLVVSGVVLGIIFLLGCWIVSTVLRPMNAVRDQMRELASGDADLSARIHAGVDDEVGQLAESFNAFVAKIAELVAAVRKSSVQLTSASNEMAATSREQEGTVSAFGSSTSQIAASVQQISATGAELIRTVDEVAEIARSSARLASTGRGNLEMMDDTMHQLQESSGSISGKLSVINERAGDITNVVTAITKVADQTNLLSVNAAIEAEKAGEYGRGFLVVAQEIRRLADQTAGASLEIEGSVQEMQTSVSAGVMEMDKFADHVRRSVNVVAEVAQQLGQIISQVEEVTGRFDIVGDGMRSQSQGADQIHEAMSSLNETVQLSVSALAEVTGVAEELRNAANILNAEIGKFRLEG